MEVQSTLKARIEALLFASDQPLSVSALLAALGDPLEGGSAAVIENLRLLIEEYEQREGGFHLVEVAGGYEFRTRESFHQDILRLTRQRPARLSQAAMETLAIIAYRQPCTKALVDRLRTVDSSAAIRTLIQRELLFPAGRAKQPGRPLLYRTTQQFLRLFGLASLEDLPQSVELGDPVDGQVLLLADYRKQQGELPIPGDKNDS
ncbi:MAG: SMC-Scp complex subunit ScpB [Bradymonadales bacterium]|nr:SMC-Scp complex subunit ScpB [Bradymonadales bacterium]